MNVRSLVDELLKVRTLAPITQTTGSVLRLDPVRATTATASLRTASQPGAPGDQSGLLASLAMFGRSRPRVEPSREVVDHETPPDAPGTSRQAPNPPPH